jgi:hypothetical protein
MTRETGPGFAVVGGFGVLEPVVEGPWAENVDVVASSSVGRAVHH